MAARGPKPKPTATKRREGNPGRRPLNTREPKLEPRVPSCPRHLDAVAKAEWKRVAGILFKKGVITLVDRGVLTAYCRAWSLAVEADKKIQKFGTVMVSEKTGAFYQSPYLNQLTAAQKDLVRYAAELGMTPSSRTRVKTERTLENDPLVELLKKRYEK